MSSAPFDADSRQSRIMAAGALLAVFGALTVLLVLLSVIRPSVLVGVMILAAGGVQLLQAIRGPELWSRTWHGGLAAIYLIGALLLFFRPELERGAVLALVLFFLADGGVRLFLGYRRAETRVALWLIASGVASVAIALLIYFGLPATASGWQLGLLVGVALFGAGGFLIWIARGPLPEPAPAPAAAPPPSTTAPAAVEPPFPRDEDPI